MGCCEGLLVGEGFLAVVGLLVGANEGHAVVGLLDGALEGLAVVGE